MATRARIGLELSNGAVISVYNHSDGYPEWLGRILKTHYNSRSLAEKLIDGGDVSSCWTGNDWHGNEWSDCKYQALTYAMRGEDCPPRLDSNLLEYLDDGEEYAYLFTKNGEWVAYHMHQFDDNKLPEPIEIPSGKLAV